MEADYIPLVPVWQPLNLVCKNKSTLVLFSFDFVFPRVYLKHPPHVKGS